jgi:hypothetical protein
MTKADYLARLGKALEGRVDDLDDILAEYEEHFARKLADGYSEEEVTARLESPEVLAGQFAEEGGETSARKRNRVFVILGLSLLSPLALAFIAALAVFVAFAGAAALAFLALGLCLVTGLDPSGLIPSMPFAGSLLLGLSSLALSLLAALGTAYFGLFLGQLWKAYFRWAGNRLFSSARPPIPMNPQLGAATRRKLRTTILVALAVMGLSFVAGFAVMAVSAGSPGFWHVWHWFA